MRTAQSLHLDFKSNIHKSLSNLTKNNRAICPLPWLHLSMGVSSEFRVCCNTDHGGYIRGEDNATISLDKFTSLEQVLNSPTAKSLRQKMRRGERDEFCNSCYNVEDSGGTSLRQISLKQFNEVLPEYLAHTANDGTIKPKVRYLDFALSNHCNLKCRMCAPVCSISLKRDFDKLGLEYDQERTQMAQDQWQNEAKFEEVLEATLSDCEEILITGGEPFLSSRHYRLLERARELGFSQNVTLRYHTNLMQLPEKIIEHWRHFKKVHVHVSIEGVASINEYVRYPAKWSTQDINFRTLLSLTDKLPLAVEVHNCFQAFAVFSYGSLFEYMAQFRHIMPIIPHFIWLTAPPQLTVQALPLTLRELAQKRILESVRQILPIAEKGYFANYNMEKIGTLIGYAERMMAEPDDPELWLRFLNYNFTFDRLRHSNLFKVFPHLRDEAIKALAPRQKRSTNENFF